VAAGVATHFPQENGLLLYFFSTSLLLLLVALTGCSPSPQPDVTGQPVPVSTVSPETPPATQPATPAPGLAVTPDSPPGPSRPVDPGGTAVLGLLGRPETLNPIDLSAAAWRELRPALFDTLLQVDPQTARLQPGLAESWEYSADGQQVTFRLPEDLKWSDGTALTAAELADGLMATHHPALLAFSDIAAPDSRTLALTFATIDCAAVTTLAQLPLIRASEITATVPTGSGPFVVADWFPGGRSLTLAPNDNYRQPGPALEGLHIRFLDEDEVAIAISEGQFDLVGPIAGPDVEFEEQGFQKQTYLAPQMIYVAINFDAQNGDAIPPELRQALLLALDREAILRETLAGGGQLLAGSLLPGHWAAPSDLSLPAYDPDRARRLLTRAGLGDSDGDGWLEREEERLEFGIRLNGRNRLHQDLGWLVSSYYRDVGLFVRAESVPADSLIDDLFTHDFNLAVFSWPIPSDPDQRLYWHSTENDEGLGLNITSYHNLELDGLLEKAVAVPGCQMEERAELYAETEQILAEDRPVDFLLAPEWHLLVGRRLRGVQPGPFAPLTWNVTEWYLAEE
jgi:peptide/nickel transport system substrate-binding protein